MRHICFRKTFRNMNPSCFMKSWQHFSLFRYTEIWQLDPPLIEEDQLTGKGFWNHTDLVTIFLAKPRIVYYGISVHVLRYAILGFRELTTCCSALGTLTNSYELSKHSSPLSNMKACAIWWKKWNSIRKLTFFTALPLLSSKLHTLR